ncbi:uncharacterized protein EDB91DRAFT_1284772 [Suillus paluster]|uniref:uncharacterized protein n=1 Tax=Suillus paluster TaxID=48578 RepID=UPI001B86B785|nr:uncharacterized protein EDB91DRAFT_1284772 [Suillus paluster]KAG1719772.1 hypothetical protein EDB91DRAFT_1284772 [Suillus paluster]
MSLAVAGTVALILDIVFIVRDARRAGMMCLLAIVPWLGVTEDLQQKKLVYLHLMNCTETQPELVILTVNTFVKDSEDLIPLHTVLMLDNPNDAVLPDSTTAEYGDAREQERQQALKDELTAVCKEEHKKNKSKFVPVATAKIPTTPIVIPSNFAVRKLKAGNYCELYYFTNKGLNEAKKNLLLTESRGLILLPGANGQQTWVNADETHDSKAVITKDENLSWEEFNEAAPRMVITMKQQEWPEDHINMHISFWTALQNHRWRHAIDALKQRTLLLYQSQWRRMWHLTAGGPHSWSIAELSHELILKAREEIFNLDRDQALNTLKQAVPAVNQNTGSRAFSGQKRPISPNTEARDQKKKPRSF